MILGATDKVLSNVQSAKQRSERNQIATIEAKLGKIITGSIPIKGDINVPSRCGLNIQQAIAEPLINNDDEESFDEKFCEDYFQSTTIVEKDGSLTVSLPFKPKA